MKKQLIFFIGAFVLLFALGALMNWGVAYEQKEKESLIHLADSVGAKKMVADEVAFLESGNTKIIEKYNVTNKKGTLVAIIYVGQSKGFADDLVVASALDVVNHKIIGMKIVSSNETDRFLAALYANEAYLNQFKDKDLTKASLEVETFSGPTPNGGNGIVAPATSLGLQNIMQLVRKQYDQDTDFTAPVEIELLSKEQDLHDLGKFIYQFKLGSEVVDCIVDQDYNLVEISDSSKQSLVMASILKNKVPTYISSATLNGDIWTITINSLGYHGNLVSTATVKDTGAILSFTSDLSDETYDNPYNSGYTGGSFNPVFEAVVNKTAITPVSGATVTSNGIGLARDILYDYIEVLTGLVDPNKVTFVSKEQDFTNLNHFKYVYTVGLTTVNLTVDRDYNVVSISHPEHQDKLMPEVNNNKVTTYIDTAVLNGDTWTITLKSKGFKTVLTSIATVKTNKTIQTFTTDLSGETYPHNPGYQGGSFDPVFDAVVSHSELPTVTGASVSRASIASVRTLLYSFIEGGFGQ